MASVMFLLILALVPITISGQSYNPLIVNQPSVSLETKLYGYIGLTSGQNGNVLVTPGTNGSVYLNGEDLLNLIEMIESQPPIWQSLGPVSTRTPYGYLGEFRAGERVNIGLGALDPEGMEITYARIAGDTPPGLSLDPKTGNVTGIIPDADATYVFTVRATDAHGKYADNKFRIVTRGYDGCLSSPCLRDGICRDEKDGITCECIRPYGGRTCDLSCPNNPLGIKTSLKYVKDAQMSAYRTYSTNFAVNGRLDSSGGWIGLGSSSYLQIDFGNTTDIYRVDTQYYSSSYYTQYFYMQYSINGADFYNYTDYTGATQRLNGMTGSGTHSETLPSVLTARFVRLFPLSWNTSYYPGLRVEMYGCYRYDKQ